MVDRVVDRSVEFSGEFSHELPRPKHRKLPLWKTIEKEFKYWVKENTKNGMAANSIEIEAFEMAFCEVDLPQKQFKPWRIRNVVGHLAKYPSFGEWARDRKGLLALEDNINKRRIIMLAAGYNLK